MVWYVTMEADPLTVDPTYGCRRDELNKVLVPMGLPDSVAVAPDEILKMVECGCSTYSLCKTGQCSCASARVAYGLMCSFCGDADICWNEVTEGQTKENDGSDNGER